MSADNYRFHTAHLWVDGDSPDDLRIGISDFAQDSLGDIVYFDLPEVGTRVTAGQPLGTVESIKVVNDLVSPVSGEVVEINPALGDNPTLANDDPYDTGWLLRITNADPGDWAALLDAAAYRTLTGR